MNVLRWLIDGTPEDHLDRSWLANRERLAIYQAYTDRQLHSCVVKDVSATQRDRFWERQADRRIAKSLRFPRKVS